jgi:hypothetical protein
VKDSLFQPTDNLYRRITWVSPTQTRSEIYCVMANGGYQSYDTLADAVAARDLFEQQEQERRIGHRFRKPREQAVRFRQSEVNPPYEMRMTNV